jgi:hypothetical protein
MVNQMLLEHEAPAFDGVQQGLFKGLGVYPEPVFKDHSRLDFLCLIINFLVSINLKVE